jgi:hypothetical protein
MTLNAVMISISDTYYFDLPREDIADRDNHPACFFAPQIPLQQTSEVSCIIHE